MSFRLRDLEKLHQNLSTKNKMTKHWLTKTTQKKSVHGES